MQLVRYYNSQSSISTGVFGANWSHGYGGHIALVSETQVDTFRGDEKTFSFKKVNGVWQPEADVKTTLVQLFDTANNPTGWRYTTGSDSQEVYDAQGRLTTLTNRAGLTQTFSYDTLGRLITVSDAFGRQLAFTYDSQNRINTATDPLGNKYLYSYDTNNNLISVTYADGATRQYVYENSQYPHALTGIIDENGTRFATWSYDGDRAVSSEHAGGVEKVTLSHDAANLKTTVQDALGATHVYAYHTYLGVAHTTSDTRSCPDCVTSTRNMSYDDQGNLLSSTDFNGVVTNYSYDTARNLETSRTEAAGTPQARTITTQWHSNFRLPIKIISPDGIKTFDYNAQGLLIKRSETSTDGAQSRVWTYTYNANGQLTQVDGARTDVADLTNYSYDALGNLVSVTDALGNITRITQYDAAGHPLSITDPNGLVTTLNYDSRGRLITQDKGGEITRYSYDKTGALLTVIQPDNTHIDYRYDAAHRLVNLQNSQGDSLTYTLGATGNRLREDWKNPSGTLTKTLQRQYDGFARLSRELGAQGQTTHYQYDNNDNLTQITDPLQRVTHYQYDSLNRLSQETDPTNAATHYQYDASDRTTQVSDHNNNATQYSYDGLGNRIEQHSPDTGSTTASYDTAGNLLSRTDANGQTTTYRYDANNRPIQTRFVDGTTINYQYDTATNGIGRLASITDPSGITAWQYNPHGRITAKLQTINLTNNGSNRPLITRYRYNSVGRLIETTYPSGLKVAYSYANGNIASLKLNGKAWLNTIHYQPDGSVAAWTWADGSQQQRGYDQDGQLISQTLSGNQRSLNYDSVGNITALIDPQTTLTLNYDAADRLIAANSQHWQYDPNSNRIQQQDNSGVTDYTIDPSSNRLLSSTGKNYQTYQHDANGNTLQDTAHSYRYDAQNRLVAVDNGKTAQYRHNALGQRVYKKAAPLNCNNRTNDNDNHTVNGKESDSKMGSDAAKGNAGDKNKEHDGDNDKHNNKENDKTVACTATQNGDHGKQEKDTASGLLFAYDETGKLIGEYTESGNAQQETVWLGNLPIATVKDNTPYAIHADHLGTPRIITDSKKRVIWRWNSDPFGATLANEDPDGDGKAFTYNLRFAGQYYDQETGLHYNYFRDYDPRTGRYIESDPIGLGGGINTYGYVGGNPVSWVDPLGLDTSDGAVSIKIPILPISELSDANNSGSDGYVSDSRGRTERSTERPERSARLSNLMGMAAKGNEARTDIIDRVGEEQSKVVREGGKRPDKCKVLEKLVEDGVFSALYAKSTLKDWGCKPSRASKDICKK